MTNLPYNEKDISSIFNYSKQLVNKCLRDFAPDAEGHRGKGSLGQLVEELFFKYSLNSRQEADFAFVNAELKCTPLKESAKKELLIKERLVCSMINYTADWNKTFEESHFYQKCLIMFIMFYLHNPKVSKLDNLHKAYPSQAVQYAELLSSVAFACHSEMLILGNVLSKHSFEQNVRMSSTSQPSFIRW